MMAVKIIQDEGIKLKGDIIIESPIEEDGSGTGTLACQARGYKANAGILTEPSNKELLPGISRPPAHRPSQCSSALIGSP